MQLQQKFISEAESALNHNDFSLLTRRLLDVCEEFKINDDLILNIFELRKSFLINEYNEGKAVLGNEIGTKAKTIINQLNSITLLNKIENTFTDKLLIEANGISKKFTQGKNPFHLQALDVKVKSGEITGVVGENGNGKTTLLRILAGELSSDTGEVLFPALNDSKNNWYNTKNQLAFIPQRIPKWQGTLLDNLRFYATIHNFTGENNAYHINYILYRLGLDKFRDLKWSEISSGYRLRFELAKMLLWKPKLLILDEPLANLDINAQQLFLQDLKFFTQSYSHPISVVLSSQNLHEIERVADNLIFIRQGKTIYNGEQKFFALDRKENSFEISGKFDQNMLESCFVNYPDIKIDNAGTSFIVTAKTNCTIYTIINILNENKIELVYIRDISQSTRKLFHKDI